MTHDINSLRNDMLKQADLEDLKVDILQTVERRMSQRSERESIPSLPQNEGGSVDHDDEDFLDFGLN